MAPILGWFHVLRNPGLQLSHFRGTSGQWWRDAFDGVCKALIATHDILNQRVFQSPVQIGDHSLEIVQICQDSLDLARRIFDCTDKINHGSGSLDCCSTYPNDTSDDR